MYESNHDRHSRRRGRRRIRFDVPTPEEMDCDGYSIPMPPPIPKFVMNGRWGDYIEQGIRRTRAKRGLLRQSILVLLSEEPRNGYQIITVLSDRTFGTWQPSPGAVYPCLQQLTDEGLVEVVDLDGQKSYQLTEAGREAAQALPAEPWAAKRDPEHRDTPPENLAELKGVLAEVKQLDRALRLLAADVSPDQLRSIAADIAALRRRIYAALAEDPGASE